MPSYLVEVYLPRSRAHEARATGRRAPRRSPTALPRGRPDPLRPHDVPARRRDMLPPLRSAHARSRRRGQPPGGARPRTHCYSDRGVPTRASARKLKLPPGPDGMPRGRSPSLPDASDSRMARPYVAGARHRCPPSSRPRQQPPKPPTADDRQDDARAESFPLLEIRGLSRQDLHTPPRRPVPNNLIWCWPGGRSTGWPPNSPVAVSVPNTTRDRAERCPRQCVQGHRALPIRHRPGAGIRV